MAATTTALRRQIGSAGDLKSVVRTMKASAASAIGQYESSVAALADYARTVELGLGLCLRSPGSTPWHPGRCQVDDTACAVAHACLGGTLSDASRCHSPINVQTPRV